jgi:hypothetical protein
MLPHKWIESDGQWLKVDSVTHGDNHFFPGPTDIAWDLAGTVVEWDLDDQSQSLFLDHYGHLSGDDAKPRFPVYRLAYSVFRMAFCKMAAAGMRGSEEEHRLTNDYRKYRAYALGLTDNLSLKSEQALPARANRVA